MQKVEQLEVLSLSGKSASRKLFPAQLITQRNKFFRLLLPQ